VAVCWERWRALPFRGPPRRVRTAIFPRLASIFGWIRRQEVIQKHLYVLCLAQKANSSEAPCSAAALLVNSESHNGACPSIRVCGAKKTVPLTVKCAVLAIGRPGHLASVTKKRTRAVTRLPERDVLAESTGRRSPRACTGECYNQSCKPVKLPPSCSFRLAVKSGAARINRP
jgi:hypothetical protein